MTFRVAHFDTFDDSLVFQYARGRYFLAYDWQLGASTIKWTTLDPCLVFSESDSKLYTNFEFCEEKNHRHF